MERAECNRNCWIAAAVAGFIVLLFTSGMGDVGLLGGLFLGLLTFGLFGGLLIWLACHDRPELFSDSDGQTVTDWAREAADSQPESLLVSGSLGPEPGPPAAGQMQILAGAIPAPPPSAPTTPAPAAAKPAEKPAEKPAAPKAAAAQPQAEKPTAQASAPKPKAGKAKASAKAKPDDLKRIKGIGPKLSDWLIENGITRYEQIAAWDAAAIADYAERLGRMGSRIEADDWVGQARDLAAGRDTEFSGRVDDGEVY